ncbi:MAG TPA: hypothetical protein VH482_05050 [Thermomicrobiales bacterium]|jgi:hypothetical protein
MRLRTIAAVAGLLLLGSLVGLAGAPNDARARLQDASPAAESSGTPEANQATQIVTLVAWYQQDPSGDFLTIGPLTTNPALVARPGGDGDTGRANFNDPDNNDLPRITIGDSTFDAYPVNPDDPDTVFRWIYFNDEQGSRPATLVMQIECTASPAYKGYTGTATFVSRASEAGGVLIIVLNPPS